MLDPHDFCSRAVFRVNSLGEMETKLDGVIYPVTRFGDDAVQVLDPDTRKPVATLAMSDGKFVLAGG